jgi:hypothetical protein
MDVLLGPHFKERGVHVGAPVFQLMWHVCGAYLRNPFVRVTFGSAVSIAGYALIAQHMRGVGPVHMDGDGGLDGATTRMLARLRHAARGKVRWDPDRKLIRYPVGVDLEAREALRLDLTTHERRRYLDRCPDAVGAGSAAVVPVAFTADLAQLFRFLARAGQLAVQRRTRRAPVG